MTKNSPSIKIKPSTDLSGYAGTVTILPTRKARAMPVGVFQSLQEDGYRLHGSLGKASVRNRMRNRLEDMREVREAMRLRDSGMTF